MSVELRAMGARITERSDGMVIQGLGKAAENGRLQPARQAQSHGDHRVAMSLAIGALTAASPMTIGDTACVETSFPDFESTLAALLTEPARGL
jgi:3-phosphoshikimate 1-carboxyvinyltransferase